MRLLLGIMCLLFLSGCGDNAQSEHYGADASPLVFSSLEENIPLKLKHLTADKPVIMNVWATWCPPCIKELPSLQALADKGMFTVMTVSIDRKPEVVKAFLHQNGFHRLPVVWDANGKALKEHFGLTGVPTTFILDKNKKVVAVEKGERDWVHPAMIAKIQSYLAHSEEQ